MILLESFVVTGALLLLALLSFVRFVRAPSQLSGGVALVFATVTPIFTLDLVRLATGLEAPRLVVVGAAAALFAQPLATLRLVAMLEVVPRRLLALATAGIAGTTVPLLALYESAPRWLLLATAAAYAATSAASAVYARRAARRRIGSAAIRLRIAAGATLLMSGSILVGLAASFVPSERIELLAVARLISLVAAFGYVLAFLAPPWLRRLWQADTTYQLSRALIRATSGDDASEIWRRFVELVAPATGVRHAALVLGSPGEDAYLVAGVGELATSRTLPAPAFDELLAAAGSTFQRPVMTLPAFLSDRREPALRYLTLFTFETSGGETGVLALCGERRSLFARDDRDWLHLLASEAATLAQLAAATAEQTALADRLVETVRALRSADRAKSDFVASMSHELRTPLNAILGFSDLMRAEPARDDRRLVPDEWIEHIHSAGRHLLELINDVLDLARVEAGRLELRLEAVAVDTAVDEVVANLRPLLDQKQLGLSVALDAHQVVVDRGRLRQVLYNLLSNAIKFTPPGGSIRIDGAADGAAVRISVTDTGVGIAPDDLERIFEEFYQAGDREARVAGSGLGLALTRRLVEAQDGRLEVASTPGEGSRFTVTLPRAAGSAPGADLGDEAGMASAPGPGAETRGWLATGGTDVLVIEDDPQAVALVRTYLEPGGYRVLDAADGVTGIALARRRRPAAIILDVLLPGIDGWEILRRLKADPDLHDVPVLIVTVLDERELGLAAGAVDYLVKPIERPALLAALRRHLPAPAAGRPRVLAIDDEPSARALVRSALEAADCEVVVVSGGREGVLEAAGGGYDLVICDLLMPDIDGFEVIAQLAAAVVTRDTPILVLTAQTLSAADKLRLNGRVVGICEKGPDTPDLLRRWVDRVTAVRTTPA